MNLSMKWLSDYVDIDCTPKEFANRMTMSGSKVETFEIEGEEISNVVAGTVISIEKHPNADSLFVCQVDIGPGEPIQIVTGATNVFAGAVVPVAMDNSTLPGGVKIKKGRLRGEDSCGMLCSLGELGLTVNDFPYADENGIFIMQESSAIGQEICSAIGLDDVKVEFEITSNRPDCLSVLGLAREAAATFDVPFEKPIPDVTNTIGDINDYLKIEVQNKTLCSRYVAGMIKNVKIQPSPRWMRERLRASGVRPINNIVDITNYVMLEYGHPMHAFNYSLVCGGKIIVRNATSNENIVTLDGINRTLSSDMLVIADNEKATAIAGVMGGEFSGIMDNTTTVIFECACFDGTSIRMTSKKLGMRTESSGRFEKGLDPQTCLNAIKRACELVQLLECGEVVGHFIDIDHSNKTLKEIPFEYNWINKFIGIDMPREKMVDILKMLEFDVQDNKILVPSFRSDVLHKADISEEIARFYGYNNIPLTTVKCSPQSKLTPMQKFENILTDTMISKGLSEIITYSFISPKYYDKINLPSDSILRKSVEISNPLGEDTSIMRTTVLPSMMEVLARNYNNRNEYAHLFEIGTEYLPTDKLPVENPILSIGMYGADVDFFKIKGIVEVIFERLHIKNWDIKAINDNPSMHPGRTAILIAGGKTLGVVGEIHPVVCSNCDIGVKVYFASLDVQTLFESYDTQIEYVPLPKYPASTRDIALICDDDLPALDIEKCVRNAIPDMLEKVTLFDVYKGKQVPEGKKSIAYSITMRKSDKTLTDEECDSAIKKVLKSLSDINVILRI